jgi:alpha-methylacyl-CoA racemase
VQDARGSESGGRGPLTGVRVIELAGIGPGPFCGMRLADLGADVIAVERPKPPGAAGLIADSGLLRRGRRSIVVDLKRPEGVDVVLRLAESADALFEGFRPGVTERLGVGPGACLERNPRLVYGRMTGYGQDGPRALEAGHDINYLSIAGVLDAIGRDGPVVPLNLIADYGGGGMQLAFGLVCGILQARASGRGQVIDVSMVDSVTALASFTWSLRNDGRWVDARSSNYFDGGAPFYDVYRCADGEWVALGSMEPQFMAAVLEGLGIDRAPYADHFDRECWPRLREELTAAFAAAPRDVILARFEGVDTCLTPVLDFDQARDDEHARARGAFLPSPGGVQPAPSPRFLGTPAPEPPAPPELGEHTDEILAEIGCDPAEMRAIGAAA